MALSPQERSRRMRLNMLMAMSYAVAGRSTWTPSNLFAAGEQGAWYDPSDFSTMFQDAAGTTPVTAVEQPVGRVLDKSGRGNHLSQSTAAARPVLSARVNLLTYTEDFRNTAAAGSTRPWFYDNVTISADSTTAPDGTTTADKMVSAAATAFMGVSYAIVGSGPGTYTWSICAKAAEATRLQLIWNLSSSTNYANFNLSTGQVTAGTYSAASITSLGNGWYRCSITSTTNNIWAYATMIPADNSARVTSFVGNGTDGLFIWGADLRPANAGVGLPAYQRVGAATDYDVSGFPYYLSFDGTDDFLVTGTINPGSVDKAQVFAGVRKLSDAAQNMLVEMSAAVASNNGTFNLQAPRSTTNGRFAFVSKGTSSATVDADASTYLAPYTGVVTGISDISADIARLRVNGAAINENTSDQGTGNFLSNIMYIGRRAGTTLPYNGRIYGLIVRFSAANLSDADISRTETWMNARTGAY